VPARTLDGAEGIRVLIHNRGHYPANVDWLRIESQATSLRLPLLVVSLSLAVPVTHSPSLWTTSFGLGFVAVI
jgi:hypothetical protein